MATQTVTPAQVAALEAEQEKPRAVSPLDDIIDATVRRQAEQAKADRLMAGVYAQGNADAPMIIALGRDFGWGPAHSLQRLYMHSGKPHLYAEARANMLQKAGYSWRPVVHTNEECAYAFYCGGQPMTDEQGKPLIVRYTMKDAEQAELVENSRGKAYKGPDGKDKQARGNYDKIPKNMLFARMITNFHRWHAPGVDGAAMLDTTEITLDAVADATEQKSADKLAMLAGQLAAGKEAKQ